MPLQSPFQTGHELCSGQVAGDFDPVLDPLEGALQAGPGGAPLDVRLPVAVPPPVQFKAEKTDSALVTEPVMAEPQDAALVGGELEAVVFSRRLSAR